MANDQATSNPGPMGWGIDSDSIKEKFNKERKAFERLATNKSLGRRPAKAVNEKALQLVLKHMDEDGIEGGFSCRHLERAIFKRFLPWKRQLIGSCFIAGTMVLMADGSEKPIEDIEVGDLVVTHNGNHKRVVNLFSRVYSGDMYTLSFDGHRDLTMTADHNMATAAAKGWKWDPNADNWTYYEEADTTVDLDWVNAANITDQDFLISYVETQYDGEVCIKTTHRCGNMVRTREKTRFQVKDMVVYDFEVEDDHSFIANGLISSNCVASGGMRAMTRRTLAEVFLLMQREELFGTEFSGTNNVAMFAPYSYRAGRSKAGINGNMDGSFCSAHIEGAMDWGMIPCWANGLDSDDYPEPQNTRTYKQWGANDSLLNKFKNVGEKFLLLESEKITSFDAHWSALLDFKPQMICSDWAFKPKAQHPTWKLADGSPVWIYTRDRSTSWPHNMTLDGALIHRGDQFTCVDNSWGDNAHKNGSFFVLEAEEMARWIRDAEIQTIGEIDLTDSGGAV